MGGIGKTQCALEYVYTNENSYEQMYWITGISESSLLSGYQTIAAKVGLPEKGSPREIAESVLHWLDHEQNWLLVIDSLDDITLIDGLLPRNGRGKHTLITTRNGHVAGIPAEGLEVPLFEKEESILLLTTLSYIDLESGSADEYEAERIVRELGYLPLAIAQAAVYIRNVTSDLKTYSVEDYNEHRKMLLQWVPIGNIQYAHSVATTWSLSLEFIRTNNPRAARLLHILSFLNPNGVLIDFLMSGANGRIFFDHSQLREVLLELEKLSLVKWNEPAGTIGIHRLLQSVIRDEMSQEESSWTFETTFNLADKAFPWELTYETRDLCLLYVNQVLPLLQRVDMRRSYKVASVQCRIAIFLVNEGQLLDGEKLFKEALETLSIMLGTDDPETLTVRNNLAVTLALRGLIAEGARLQNAVLKQRIIILGEDHRDTLHASGNCAAIYGLQGHLGEAAKLQEKVLKKRTMIFGEDYPDTFHDMGNLAVTYSFDGSITKAANLQEELFEKFRRLYGDEHPNTLDAMGNLAMTYLLHGRIADAINLREKVLETRQRILGVEHPATRRAMSNIERTREDAHPRFILDIHDRSAMYYWQFGNVNKMLEEDGLERVKFLGQEGGLGRNSPGPKIPTANNWDEVIAPRVV